MRNNGSDQKNSINQLEVHLSLSASNMRFFHPLGFSVLLVVTFLGLLCVSPISGYYYEDTQPLENNTQISAISSPSDSVGQVETEVQLGGVQDEDTHQADKRQFGQPSATGEELSSRDSVQDQQVTRQQPSSEKPDDDETGATSQQQRPGQPEDSQQRESSISAPANQPEGLDQSQAGTQTRLAAASEGSKQPAASSARGFGSFVSSVNQMVDSATQSVQQQNYQLPAMNTAQLLPQQQQQEQLEQHQQPSASRSSAMDVPKEHLPTIIENNKPVDPKQQQEQQRQEQQQQQQAQQQGPATGLVAPNQSPAVSNANASAARTFGEGWTNCVGTTSNKYGTCKNDVECKKSKGFADGSCMGGLGACCVMALTCGDKSIENNTFFANPDFPDPSWEARLCEVEIKKKHKKILQVMIEFEEFELAPPNHEGECITDVFQVKLASSRPSPYSLLRICGQNTGQHMYLDVSQIDEPLVLSVATSGGGFPRRWSIRIVQMDEKNFLLAPPGCLQYYTDTVGHFRSFNLGRNLKNLYYAVCFRIDNGYSGIRFTSNFFGMNGPMCRRPPMKHMLAGLLGAGRHNGSHIEAHPHHLVIPPPGYAPPPPRPKLIEGPPAHHYHHMMSPPPHYQHHQQHPYQATPMPGYQEPPTPTYHVGQPKPGSQPLRYKRFAYSEPSERVPRTFGSEHEPKEFKLDEKKFKSHEAHEPHEFHHLAPIPPHHQAGYGPPPPHYGQAPPPPPPPHYGHPGYGHEYPHHFEGPNKKEEFKETKWFEKDAKKGHHPHEMIAGGWGDDKKSWWEDAKFWKASDKKDDKFGWKDDKFGWKGDKKDDKFGWKSDKEEEKYGYGPQAAYYSSGYGPPAHAYGHPTQYPAHHLHHAGHPPHHGHQHHAGYGPAGYPHGYGPGYGEYHHKEIDKFGKKFEHLEYKHEKNHFDKEGKKDEKSWWFWGKKDEKKDKKDKEKFFNHHEALFPMMHIPEMPHCEPRFCGQNDVITFPPSGDSISEMCGNRFNRGRGPKIISGSPLVVYVSNRGHSRGAGFDMNYEQVFYIPRPY